MCYNAYTLFRGRISATMRSRFSCGVIGIHWQAPRSRIARLLIRHAELVWRGEGGEGKVCQKSSGRRTSQQRRYPSQPRSPSSRSWAPAALALLWVVPFDVGMCLSAGGIAELFAGHKMWSCGFGSFLLSSRVSLSGLPPWELPPGRLRA